MAAALFGLLAAVPDARAGSHRGPIVSLIPGNCQSLIVAGQAATSLCRPELVGIIYPSGEISFVFGTSGGRLVSFKGRTGHAQGSQTTLAVRRITIVSGSSARSIAVTGSCVFSGVATARNHIQCEVAERGVRYAAIFLTRGDISTRYAL